MNSDQTAELFAEKVRTLLRVAGAADAVPADDRLRATLALLAELYALGLQLPETAPGEETLRPRGLYPPLHFNLGGPRAYFRHANPDQRGTEEVGDLGEDFEDLHGELTRGLALFESGTDAGRRMAQAHWRRTLPHWGHHAVEAIRALHYRLLGLPGGGGD